MRLAHDALALANPAATTVTRIANNFGFSELGRFSVSFRVMFGEEPSETLRRPFQTPPPQVGEA
jgi:AraC-like DNA-binding protein